MSKMNWVQIYSISCYHTNDVEFGEFDVTVVECGNGSWLSSWS